MRLVKREGIEKYALRHLGISAGDVREIEEMKEFARTLEGDEGLFRWWRIGMGFVKEGG